MMWRAAVLALLAVADASSVTVLIFGESFRENSHQGSRNFGPAGLQSQKEASLSQVVFILHTLVFDLGYTVRLHVYTQQTGLERELERWYAPYTTSFVADPSYGGLRFADFIRQTMSDTDDAFLFFRPDIMFKPVTPSALAAASKILYPFELGPELVGVDSEGHNVLERRVCDQLTWIPRAYFKQLSDAPERYIRAHWAPNDTSQGGSVRWLSCCRTRWPTRTRKRSAIASSDWRGGANRQSMTRRAPRTERFCNTTFDSLLYA